MLVQSRGRLQVHGEGETSQAGHQKVQLPMRPDVVRHAAGPARTAWSESGEDGEDSFHRAMAGVLVTAQVFALMPVHGVTSQHATGLEFCWLSLRVVYSLSVIACHLVILAAQTYLTHQTPEGITFKSSAGIVFFSVSLAGYLCFLELALRWPALARHTHVLERELHGGYGEPRGLSRSIRLTAAWLLVEALAEHALANTKAFRLSLACTDWSSDWVDVYYAHGFPVATLLGAHPVVLGVVQATGVAATFAWNFVDLFVALVSIMLAARLKQVNARIDLAAHAQTQDQRLWVRLHEDFCRVSAMVHLFAESLSKTVFLSVGANLYFICLQLLNSLTPRRDALESVYFFASLGHLLARSTAVCYLAAQVHEQAAASAPALRSVASVAFTPEVERLLHHVTKGPPTLTGLNFFPITKTLLLTLAGTIASYEVVLVQMAGLHGSRDAASPSNVTDFVNPFCPNKFYQPPE